jgi:hypothetical protein
VERAARVREVVEGRRRRAAGEGLPDKEVLATYAQLMPELGDELCRLRCMGRGVEPTTAPAFSLMTTAVRTFMLPGLIRRAGQCLFRGPASTGQPQRDVYRKLRSFLLTSSLPDLRPFRCRR